MRFTGDPNGTNFTRTKNMLAALIVTGASCIGISGHARANATLVRKLPAEVTAALNQQIQYELDGAQEYLSLATSFYAKNLSGFGAWYTAQYAEELNHARMMIFFLTDKDESPEIGGTSQPVISFTTAVDAASQSLAFEEIQTDRINKLYDLAVATNARDAASFLLFFINEQVQEEASFKNQVDKLTLAGDDRAALLAMDKDLGARVVPPLFMPPPAP